MGASMKILGIDPGIKGGLALLSDDGLIVERMPVIQVKGKNEMNGPAVGDMIESLTQATNYNYRNSHGCFVIIERQWMRPGKGAASQARVVGDYRYLCGVLDTLSLQWEEVAPATWKRAMGVSGDKTQSRLVADRLFPQNRQDWKLVRDDGLAEAALLAEYCRRHIIKAAA